MSVVISIAHDKGGVGKTTISSNILATFAKDMKVKAIDLDPKNHLSKFLSRRADKNIELIDISSAAQLKELLDTADGLVVLDIGGMDTDLTRFAIVYSDLIITPVADSQVEIDGLVDFIQVIQKLREVRADLKAHVLLNRIHPASSRSVEDLKEFVSSREELELFDTVIRDRVAFKNAYANAQSVSEYAKQTKADIELRNLIKEIKVEIDGKI